MNRSLETERKVVSASSRGQIKVLGVADCRRRQLVELGQLVPLTFVVGVLQPRHTVEVAEQDRPNVAGFSRREIQMRHASAGPDRKRILQELRQTWQRVF